MLESPICPVCGRELQLDDLVYQNNKLHDEDGKIACFCSSEHRQTQFEKFNKNPIKLRDL